MKPLLILSTAMFFCIPAKAQYVQEIEKALETAYFKRDSLLKIQADLYQLAEKTTDSSKKRDIESEKAKQEATRDQHTHEELLLEFKFIRSQLSSSKSLDILSNKIWRRESLNFADSFYVLYQLLPKMLRESSKGVILKKDVLNFKKSSIGNASPEIVANDINNHPFSLSKLKSNYILLDFWASWCVPCREDFPFVKQLFQKYNSKGLKVVAISRDDDTAGWTKAIQKDKINSFIHISTKLNKDPILDNYFIWAIPVIILIDKEGKIIGRWRGGGTENKTALAEMLERLLGSSVE
jgi:thiol-disulfide isomerase/thioredoxin